MERLRSREIKNEPNKLSGDSHELHPNTRTSTPTSKTDQEMEALAKIDRSCDTRKGKAKVSHNAFKEGLHGTLREISVLLREQRKFLKSILM